MNWIWYNMEWYWYLTGVVTTVCGLSVLVNLGIISQFIKIEIRRPVKTRMKVLYDWSDDSGPISRAG